jgi:hypothetical protein
MTIPALEINNINDEDRPTLKRVGETVLSLDVKAEHGCVEEEDKCHGIDDDVCEHQSFDSPTNDITRCDCERSLIRLSLELDYPDLWSIKSPEHDCVEDEDKAYGSMADNGIDDDVCEHQSYDAPIGAIVQCECGGLLLQSNMRRHVMSNTHAERIRRRLSLTRIWHECDCGEVVRNTVDVVSKHMKSSKHALLMKKKESATGIIILKLDSVENLRYTYQARDKILTRGLLKNKIIPELMELCADGTDQNIVEKDLRDILMSGHVSVKRLARMLNCDVSCTDPSCYYDTESKVKRICEKYGIQTFQDC